MTLHETMTALANGVRKLSDTPSPKSLEIMIENIDAANAEITAQTELINQITTALKGKGGVTNNSTIETCTGLLTLADYDIESPSPIDAYTCYYMNNNLELVSFSGLPTDNKTFQPVKNSIFVITNWHNMDGNCGASESCTVLLGEFSIAICTANDDFSMEYMN